MICMLCKKDVPEKFYLHLNAAHKMRKGVYLDMFPEQKEEYYKQKPDNWNKGLTKETSPSVMQGAMKSKEYHTRSDVREKQSQRMKDRYKGGDILSKEVRAKIAKAGSDGWVKKVQEASDEERRKMLENFTKAGNEAQSVRRSSLTPDDYMRLYPFAKGKAQYYNCDYCETQFIAWFGGKPRPRRRFCDLNCFHSFQLLHPHSMLPQKRFYYSEHMGMEFYLHSNLEEWFASILDQYKLSWHTTPFCIPYLWEGRQRRYYPDFIIENRVIVELKSGYVNKLQGVDRNEQKFMQAQLFAERLGLEFIYIEFDKSNLTYENVCCDPRVLYILNRFK